MPKGILSILARHGLMCFEEKEVKMSVNVCKVLHSSRQPHTERRGRNISCQNPQNIKVQNWEAVSSFLKTQLFLLLKKGFWQTSLKHGLWYYCFFQPYYWMQLLYMTCRAKWLRLSTGERRQRKEMGIATLTICSLGTLDTKERKSISFNVLGGFQSMV